MWHILYVDKQMVKGNFRLKHENKGTRDSATGKATRDLTKRTSKGILEHSDQVKILSIATPNTAITKCESTELSDLRRELMNEPEFTIEIVKTGRTELETDLGEIEKEHHNWGAGGKRLGVASYGSIAIGGVLTLGAILGAPEIAAYAANVFLGTGLITLLANNILNNNAAYTENGLQVRNPHLQRLANVLNPKLGRASELIETTGLLREAEVEQVGLLTEGKKA